MKQAREHGGGRWELWRVSGSTCVFTALRLLSLCRTTSSARCNSLRSLPTSSAASNLTRARSIFSGASDLTRASSTWSGSVGGDGGMVADRADSPVCSPRISDATCAQGCTESCWLPPKRLRPAPPASSGSLPVALASASLGVRTAPFAPLRRLPPRGLLSSESLSELCRISSAASDHIFDLLPRRRWRTVLSRLLSPIKVDSTLFHP